MQRWVSPDPLEVHVGGSGDLNLYAYVSGTVLKSIDPLGLEKDYVQQVSFQATESNPSTTPASGKFVDSEASNAATLEAVEAYYANKRRADAEHEAAREWQEGRMKPSHLSPMDEGGRSAGASMMVVNASEGRYNDAYGRTDWSVVGEDSIALSRLSGSRGFGPPPMRAQSKPPPSGGGQAKPPGGGGSKKDGPVYRTSGKPRGTITQPRLERIEATHLRMREKLDAAGLKLQEAREKVYAAFGRGGKAEAAETAKALKVDKLQAEYNRAERMFKRSEQAVIEARSRDVVP